ncbi:MAG: hypothetical protein WCS60_04715, partial [Hydrogenophaga sp.]
VDLLGGLINIVDAPVTLKAKLLLSIPEDASITKSPVIFDFDPNVPRTDQPNLYASVGTEHHLGATIGSAISRNLLEAEVDTDGLKLLALDLSVLSEIVDTLINSIVKILGGVLGVLGSVLTPILSLLDAALGPLLSALGLQLGYTDVQLMSADCDNAARLVY